MTLWRPTAPKCPLFVVRVASRPSLTCAGSSSPVFCTAADNRLCLSLSLSLSLRWLQCIVQAACAQMTKCLLPGSGTAFLLSA